MYAISQTVGDRIRTYRKKKGLSQETLAEKSDLHPTYISQIERGEKKLSIVSLEKILSALEVTFSEFFQHIESGKDNDGENSPNYAAKCYDLVHKWNTPEQARMYHALWEIDQLMEAVRQGLAGR